MKREILSGCGTKDLSNGRKCEDCKHSQSGVIHGYPWMTCTKNWSDKQNGVFFGVLKDYCNNFQRRVVK